MLSTNDQSTDEQSTPTTPEYVQGCLLSLGIGLTLLSSLIVFSGPVILPVAAIVFLLSMLHAVFLVSLYPTIIAIRSLHWLAYGISLIVSGVVMTYCLGQAELYRLPFVFVAVVFVEIFMLSWRSQRRRALFQYGLLSVGLLGIPLAVAVRDPGVLAETVYKGDMTHTRFLLALGADVRARDSRVLHSALVSDARGSREMMRLLLDRGADPNVAADPSYGKPVLTIAVNENRLDLLRLLLAYGADPNRDNSSALFLAVSSNQRPMVDLLLAHGANVRARGERGWSPLFVARDAAMARSLIERGVELDARDQLGQTALFQVVRDGDVATVAVLLDQGFDVNARDAEERTPLMAAADYTGGTPGNKVVGSPGYAIVEYLIERGADVRAADRNGRTALSAARRQNERDVEALLRAAGATD